MRHSVAIIGNGMLADMVNQHLSGIYQITRWSSMEEAVPNAENLALVLHDSWIPAEHLKADEIFRSCSIPWLRGFVFFGEANIGPLVLPDKQGCSQCADVRRFMTGPDRREHFQIKEYKRNEREITPDPWASNLALWQTSILIQEEVNRFLKGENSLTTEHVFLLHLNTLSLSQHFFLPDPYCHMCGDLPEDTPDNAKLQLNPSPKIAIDNFRCRSMDELSKVLSRDYLKSRTGLLNYKRYDFTSPFADTIVNLPLLSGDELNAGRTHSYLQSELAGILEGLERNCGYAPRGKQTMVYAPFRKWKNMQSTLNH
jgi:ribosomal protein S12 methylthiotransferase accessory factor